MHEPLDRREFVRRFVLGSVTSLVTGKVSTAPALGAILSGPVGVLKVKLSDYPALANPGGSIQLQFSGATPHPLMINRGPGNTFYALDSDCQHQHCTVPPYSAATGMIRCTCHGSRYAIDGALIGGPAMSGLNTFACTFDGLDTVSVQVPGLFFHVTNIAVQATQPARRLRLTFNILPFATYQVFYQPTLSSPRQVALFSTTAAGAANMGSAFTTVSPVTVYVDTTGSSGFYTVALLASLYASSSAPAPAPPAPQAVLGKTVTPRPVLPPRLR